MSNWMSNYQTNFVKRGVEFVRGGNTMSKPNTRHLSPMKSWHALKEPSEVNQVPKKTKQTLANFKRAGLFHEGILMSDFCRFWQYAVMLEHL